MYNGELVNFFIFQGQWWFELLQQPSDAFVNNDGCSKAKEETFAWWQIKRAVVHCE